MKRFIMGAILASVVLAGAGWITMQNDDYWFPGNVSVQKSLDIKEADGLKIEGTAVTVSATELNAAGAGTTDTLAPSLVSNAVMKVYGSNLVIKTGGTVTVPSGSIAAVSVATNTLGAKTITLVDAGVSTNVLYFSAQGILTNATSNP